jgi:ATP-binding cassette subfamily B protein
MKKIRQLLQFLRGQRLTFALTLLCVIVNVLFAATVPLIIRTGLDSVLGGKPVDLPAGLANVMGGADTIAWLNNNLWFMLVLLVGMTLMQGILLFGRGKLGAMTSEGAARRMRDRLYNHLERLPFDWHVKAQTGDIIQRCTSDIETVMNFVGNQFIEAFSTVFQVIIVLMVMSSMSVPYTLVTVALIPVITIATVRFFLNMMKVFSETDEAEGFMSATLQENLTGVRVVKAFAAQQLEMDKFDEKNSRYRDLVMKIVKLMAGYWSVSDFLCMVQYGAVIVVGAYWAAIGNISIGTLVAFSTYAGMLIWPIRGLGQSMGFMGQSFVSLGRINEILDTKPEDYETGKSPSHVEGSIEFANVRIGYDPETPVLEDVSFTVRKGTTTAILGATGSGKSSILHLLLRCTYIRGAPSGLTDRNSHHSRSHPPKNRALCCRNRPFLAKYSENIRMAGRGFRWSGAGGGPGNCLCPRIHREFVQGY